MSPIRCVDSDLDLRECLWVQCATSKGQGAHTSDARLKQARAPAQANPTQEQPAIDGGQCDRPFGVVTTCSPNEPARIEVPVLALKVMSPDLTSARPAIDQADADNRPIARTRHVQGQSGSVRGNLGGRRVTSKKNDIKK